jgi:hypothetical protein
VVRLELAAHGASNACLRGLTVLGGFAHQRIIREDMAERHPREQVASLEGYSVETISREEATKIILHYEWLGTVGKANIFIGLLSPTREVHGVACFGYGPAGNIRNLIGSPALCLERGACVHYAPKNAASFLINNACKLVYRMTGTALFFAYGDPMAGEYGGVYQAAGWLYLGQGLDGKKGRKRRTMVLPPGADANHPGNWKTTRELRRAGRRMGFAEAREQGWRVSTREAKHVYAHNVGRERHKWRKNFACPPYPNPRPEMKRTPKEPTDHAPSRATVVIPFRLATAVASDQMALDLGDQT